MFQNHRYFKGLTSSNVFGSNKMDWVEVSYSSALDDQKQHVVWECATKISFKPLDIHV